MGLTRKQVSLTYSSLVLLLDQGGGERAGPGAEAPHGDDEKPP